LTLSSRVLSAFSAAAGVLAGLFDLDRRLGVLDFELGVSDLELGDLGLVLLVGVLERERLAGVLDRERFDGVLELGGVFERARLLESAEDFSSGFWRDFLALSASFVARDGATLSSDRGFLEVFGDNELSEILAGSSWLAFLFLEGVVPFP